MQIEQIQIEQLKEYARNSRTHDKEQIQHIANSIKEFGFTSPVLIRDDMTIIGGHGRLQAAKLIGLSLIPCIRLSHLTPEQAVAYTIADNALADLAGWDKEMLKMEIADLQISEFNLDLLGLDNLDELLAQIPGQDGLTDPDDVTGTPAKAVTELGDLYILGRHRLMCGDATSNEALIKLMGGRKAELVITDPPYGVSYADKNNFLNKIDKGNRNQTEIQNDHLSKKETQEMWKKSFQNMADVMIRGAVVYCFMPQGGDQMMMMMEGAGIEPRHELIWLKNNHVLGRADYAYKHEPILYAWKDAGHKYYGGFQTSILEYAKPQKSDLHPTMKPVALIEHLIQNSSGKNGLLYEPFAGSGTTVIACEKNDRYCYAMELSPHYCDVIVTRWENFTGKKAVLVKP